MQVNQEVWTADEIFCERLHDGPVTTLAFLDAYRITIPRLSELKAEDRRSEQVPRMVRLRMEYLFNGSPTTRSVVLDTNAILRKSVICILTSARFRGRRIGPP